MKDLSLLMLILVANRVQVTDFGDYHGAEYVRNYDGDTVTFNLPELHPLIGNKISIRINGIDTPEIKGECQQEMELAVKAKKLVEDILIEAESIDLISMQRGKYFRIIADVVAGEVMVKDALIGKGLAVRYQGGTKIKDWCGG